MIRYIISLFIPLFQKRTTKIKSFTFTWVMIYILHNVLSNISKCKSIHVCTG